MKIFISIIFLTVAISLFSQNTKIDSLQQKLAQAQGKERISMLNELAIAYWNVDLDKSIRTGKEALRLAELLKFTKVKARSYNIIGVAYSRQNNSDMANQYYDKCISTANSFGTKEDIYKALSNKITLYINGYKNNTTDLIRVFKQFQNMTIEKNNFSDFQRTVYTLIYILHSKNSDKLITEYLIDQKNKNKNNTEIQSVLFAGEALYYSLNMDYFKAIEKYETALNITKDLSNKTIYLDRIGVIYFEVRKYKESVQFLEAALKNMNEIKIESSSISAAKYIVPADLGASYLNLKDYKSAITYLQYALNSPELIPINKAVVYNNLGLAYLSIDSLEKADFYLKKAIPIFDNLKVRNEKLAALNCKAELFRRRKQWNQLSTVINEISKLSKDVKDYYIVYDSYKLLSGYYEKSGKYKESNEYLKKWITTNDSINSREVVTKMKEFEFKYETKKKEQLIALQLNTIKDKNLLLALSIIAGSLIFAALLVIFILYRIRNKAYKQLVYQSLQNTSNAQLLKIEEPTDEVDVTEIKSINSVLDESLKSHIEVSLNKQIDSKIYLEPNIILKTLAEKCDTNRSYLSQFINERYNMNFNTFINTLRINEAKQILSDKDNNIPLKELYLRLGFNTYSVFNEAFKKHVGVTPAFYLKTVKDLFDVSNPNKIQ